MTTDTPPPLPLLRRPFPLVEHLESLWGRNALPYFNDIASPFDDGRDGPRRRSLVRAAVAYAKPLIYRRSNASGLTPRDEAQEIAAVDADEVLLLVDLAISSPTGRPVNASTVEKLEKVAGIEARARANRPATFGETERWRRGITFGVLEVLESLAALVLAPAGNLSAMRGLISGLSRACGMPGDSRIERQLLSAVSGGMIQPDFARFEPYTEQE